MSHGIDKQAFEESLLKGILDSGIVKGVDLEADVEVIPGDINTKRLEDGVKKAAEKASKNIGAINVPVDVNQNLSRSDQKKVEKIIENINKTAFNKNDYRSRKSGTINQGWFDSAVNELKELETTLETLDLDKLQRVAELYAQINGIVSGRYKPKSKIDTSGVDLGFLNKLTSGRIRGRVEDLVGGYVPRSYGRSTGSFAQNVDLSSYKAETDAINTLKQAVDEVTRAVNAKTEAFKNEHDFVQRYVDDEVNALQRLQEKAGQGINLAVTPTYTNQPTTVASPRSKTTVTGRYSWGNEVSVSAVAKGIKDADLKPIINEIERFNQDGSFDPVATLNALKEFKQKIGILSESKSLQEFYDTAVKMKAFNEILGKIKSSNVSTDEKEYKTGYRYLTGQTIKKGEPIPLDVSRLKELSAEAVSAKKTADATIRDAQDELKETARESQEASQATQQVLTSLSDTAKTFLQILQDILFKTEEIRQRANTSNNGKEYATLNDYYDDHPSERPKSKQVPSEELLSIAQATQDIAGYVETIQDVITAKKEEAAAIRESTKQVTEESAASEALEETKEKHAGLLSSMLQAIKEEREKAQAKYADYPADLDFDALDNPYLRDNAQFLVPMEWVKGMASRAVGAIKDRVSGLIKSFVDEFTPALAQRDGLNSDVTSINFKDAVNAQTQALASDTGVAGFQETLNTLTQLETKLKTDIPAAVQKKTEAFAQELKDVTGYIDKETGVLNRFKDDVKDLLSEDQTRSSTEPSFLESELSGIESLRMALDTDIPAAIDVKNKAFEDERNKVIGWVEEETAALGKLDEAAKGVTPPQSPTANNRAAESYTGFNGGQNNGSQTVSVGGKRSNNWNLPSRTSIFDDVDLRADDLAQEVIGMLTAMLGSARGDLFNYYDKSRQIATGKFDLNQLSKYYRTALPVRDIMDNLSDISWLANQPSEDGKGYANEALHKVYEAFIAERDAVVDTTAKVLEQGSLIGDISNILYDGSKTLVARMNELARYAMDNAGDIHSAYSQTEREEDALAAIRYLSKNAGKHFKNNALAKSGLLKGGPAANLDLENNEWKYNEQLIRPFINNMDSAQDKVRKKLEGLLRGINHIVNDVVPDTIDSAKAKAADLTANSLENNSPMAKAYRAYGRLSKQDGQNGANYYHTLKKFQDNGMLYGVKNADKLPAAEVNKLLDDQKAKLADIEAKRQEELKLIGAISDKELASNKQLLERKSIYNAVEDSAERYAEARFTEAKVKLGQSKYNGSINSIYDAFYRAENFTQKRDTVGITDLEEQELQKAIRNYNELRGQLEAIAEKSDEAKAALELLNDKESKASDKLKNKWSDARDRRYGSYLNEGDAKGLYGPRNDVLAGLQRYATREGAKGFQLFDGKTVGNIQKYRAEVENTDGTIEKLNLTLNKTTGELYSVSMGTKQSTSFFEQFSEGLKRRAISLAQYAMTFASLRTAIQAFRAAINNVKDLDSAFVELSRISHDSSAALEEFRKKSFEVADQVGSTAAQVINSAAQWEHLGYNVKEAGELAKVSSIYKNIADGMSSDSEATEDLVAIMKAYDFTAEQAIDVTDALIAVSNNYAVTAADIGNALKRSASAMSVANNTFEQNVALATAMAEVTQNAEKSGSALQVLSLRIRGAKTELEDMGEETDGMATSTSKLRDKIKGLTKGFDIMKDDKTFKSTYEIMKGISKVWKDLDDISKASLLETLAGCTTAGRVQEYILTEHI